MGVLEPASRPKERDRWFDPYTVPKGENAKAVVAHAIADIESFERRRGDRKRARKARDQAIFETTVSLVLANVMRQHLVDPGRAISISRSHRDLGRASASRYKAAGLSRKLPDILDALANREMGYLKQVKGIREAVGEQRTTTIKAASRLISLIESYDVTPEDFGVDIRQEVIILKSGKEDFWDGGKRIEYEDTQETVRLREQMYAINSRLAEAEISCLSAIPGIDDTDRLLKRIFNAGRFDRGGRLFGGFWQRMKKEHRLDDIVIGEDEVVELDYGQMGPRILYGHVGAEMPPGDPYDIGGLRFPRDGIKKVFNAMVAAAEPLKRFPRGTRKHFSSSTRFNKVADRIIEAHPALKEVFYQGLALHVQFIESEILVELLLDLKAADIVALPIHDAVLVSASDKDYVRERMLAIFQQRTGIEGEVSEVAGWWVAGAGEGS